MTMLASSVLGNAAFFFMDRLFWRKVPGLLLALLVGGFTTGAQGQAAPGVTPGFGGELRGILKIQGKVLCAKCTLDEVQKTQPELSNLYEISHRLGQVVMQVEEVSEPSLWRYLTQAPLLRARGADRFLLQLAAEENLFQEVEIMGLLRDTRILDISGVTVLEQGTLEKEENIRPFAASFFEKLLR